MHIEESLSLIAVAVARVGVAALARETGIDRRTITSFVRNPPMQIETLKSLERAARNLKQDHGGKGRREERKTDNP